MTRTANYNSNSFGAGGYVRQTALLTPEQEKDLWQRWVDHDDMAARATFLKSYLPFCQAMAWEQARHHPNSHDLMHDLFGEAECAMVQLFDRKKFDPSLGNRFSTYAMPWIKNHLLDFMMDNKAPFRMCTTSLHRKLFNNYSQIAATVLAENGALTPHQRHVAIAEKLGVYRDKKVEPADIAEYEIKSASISVSGDSCLYDGNENETLITQAVSDDAPPEHSLENEDKDRLVKLMLQALDSLDERTKKILEQRFLAPESCTLKDLSVVYGVSFERIRQIEARGLRMMKQILTETELPPRVAAKRDFIPG